MMATVDEAIARARTYLNNTDPYIQRSVVLDVYEAAVALRAANAELRAQLRDTATRSKKGPDA